MGRSKISHLIKSGKSDHRHAFIDDPRVRLFVNFDDSQGFVLIVIKSIQRIGYSVKSATLNHLFRIGRDHLWLNEADEPLWLIQDRHHLSTLFPICLAN